MEQMKLECELFENLTTYLLKRFIELNNDMAAFDLNKTEYETLYHMREEIIKALRKSGVDIDGYIANLKFANRFN